jgi:hypothetical protein
MVSVPTPPDVGDLPRQPQRKGRRGTKNDACGDFDPSQAFIHVVADQETILGHAERHANHTS